MDYAQSVCKGYSGATLEHVLKRYSAVAAAVGQACDKAASVGAAVVRQVRRADFAAVFDRRPRVVTLLAHFRSLDVDETDLVDVPAIERALARPDAVVAEVLSELQRLGYDAAADLSTRRRLLANAMSALTQREEERSQSDPDDGLMIRCPRGVLEEAFYPGLRPGRAIEFRDGLATIPEFVDCVPIDFDGLLDLTLCRSTICGEALRRRRSVCLAKVNRLTVDPIPAALRYTLTLMSLARAPRPYLEVVAEAVQTFEIYATQRRHSFRQKLLRLIQ